MTIDNANMKLEFDAIFLKYHRRLYLYAMKFVDNRDEALDLVQEVFKQFWEREEISTEEKVISAYLFKSIKNSSLNLLKRKRVEQKYVSSVLWELKSDEADYYLEEENRSILEEDLKISLHRAIAALPEEYREIIIMSKLQNLTSREISEVLDIPVRSVETKIYRGIKRLKRELDPHSVTLLLLYFNFF